jgi:hypothetical protein
MKKKPLIVRCYSSEYGKYIHSKVPRWAKLPILSFLYNKYWEIKLEHIMNNAWKKL